jgi:hypothetical protein
MKILILGGSRHGKTSAAEYLQSKYRLRFKDASLHAAELFIRKAMSEVKYYKTAEQCHEDRHQFYDLWRELINAYCKDNPARLVASVMRQSDLYVGLRSLEHFNASKHMFDLILYVDASPRVDIDPAVQIPFDPLTMRPVNNWDLDDGADMRRQIDDIMRRVDR